MKKIRRYDLDWLRVIVFLLLILYHVGMFFVPWSWHIKNNVIYDWLQLPMLFVNQWRLPILFVISGMGTSFALSYRSAGQFIKERNLRLGIPLVVGMLLIIPPQVYVERIVDGDFSGDYLSFWPNEVFKGIYPEGNFSWHHLWFLPYLLVYSILLTPLFIYFRNHPDNKLASWLKTLLSKDAYTIYLLVIPLYLFESLLEPFFEVTHNLLWDWFNFISSLTLFFYGFILIAVQEEFWKVVVEIRRNALIIGIITFLLMISLIFYVEDGYLRHFTEAALKVVSLWSWILVLFGYASTGLNKKSKWLAYCNEAVYPFYILHQTITVIIAYYLKNMEWNLFTKASILTLGTFVGCFILYEFMIRRAILLRPLFGLKNR
ncbi:MAG TPA: acyltransferase family protein [Cyclobacteriaceae bacterium]